jgi:hypothetical protein
MSRTGFRSTEPASPRAPGAVVHLEPHTHDLGAARDFHSSTVGGSAG